MKYAPFCSVDIEFGKMDILKKLIEESCEDKKTVIVCDKMLSDMWGLTALIEKGVEKNHISWIDECPANPVPKELIKALNIVGNMEPVRIIAVGGGSAIDNA